MCGVLAGENPPEILSGDLSGLLHFDLVSALGPLTEYDVDGDGLAEGFFVAREVYRNITYRNIVELDGKDTVQVAGFPEEEPHFYMSLGFLDVSGDRVLEALVAFWSNGYPQLVFFDLGVNQDDERRELMRLSLFDRDASFEVHWPTVTVHRTDGTTQKVMWSSNTWVTE